MSELRNTNISNRSNLQNPYLILTEDVSTNVGTFGLPVSIPSEIQNRLPGNNTDSTLHYASLDLPPTNSNSRQATSVEPRTIYATLQYPHNSRDDSFCFSSGTETDCSFDTSDSDYIPRENLVNFSSSEPEEFIPENNIIFSDASNFEFDEMHNKVRSIFNNQVTCEKDMAYYTCRILALNYNFADVLSYLENSHLLQDILKSEDDGQYDYIIELLYTKMSTSSKTTDGNEINRSFDIIKRIANAIIRLPRRSPENVIFYDRLYQLLNLYVNTNLPGTVAILDSITDIGTENDLFNFNLGEHRIKCSQEFIELPNSYFNIIEEIANIEKTFGIKEGAALRLLRKALKNIKITLARNTDDKHCVYFSKLLSNLMNNFKLIDSQQIMNSFIEDENVPERFKDYLRIAVNTFCDDLNVDISDIEQSSSAEITSQITDYTSYKFVKTEFTIKRNTAEERKIQKLRSVPTKNNITVYQNPVYRHHVDTNIFNQSIRVINGVQPLDTTFNTQNKYNDIMRILFLYDTSAVLIYLDNNLDLINDIIDRAFIDQCNDLMTLLYSKLSNRKLKPEQITSSYWILRHIAQRISDTTRQTNNHFSQLCGQFNLILHGLADHLTAEQINQILSIMLDSRNAASIFRVEVSRDEQITNNYLSLLLIMAKKEVATKKGKNKSESNTSMLLKKMLKHIPNSILTKDTPEVLALFFARYLADIIKKLPEHERNNIILIIYNCKSISVKFKNMFYAYLKRHHIDIDKIYKLSSRECARIREQIEDLYTINQVRKDPINEVPIKLSGLYLSESEATNLMLFDNYLSLNPIISTEHVANNIRDIQVEETPTAEDVSWQDDIDYITAMPNSGGATGGTKAETDVKYNYSVVDKRNNTISDTITNIDLEKRLKIIKDTNEENKSLSRRIIKVLSTYNSHQVLNYLNENTLVEDILNGMSMEEYVDLIKLLLMKSSEINSEKDVDIALAIIKAITKSLARFRTSTTTAILYGHIYQLLNCYVNKNTQAVREILTSILAASNNSSLQYDNDNNNVVLNDCCFSLFANLIIAESRNNQNTSCSTLLKSFIDKIKINIQSELGSVPVNQLLFVARRLAHIITLLSEANRNQTLISLFQDSNVSQRFKIMLYSLLRVANINIDGNIFSLPREQIININEDMAEMTYMSVNSLNAEEGFLNFIETNLLEDSVSANNDVNNRGAIRRIIRPLVQQNDTFVAPIPYLLTLINRLRSENIIYTVYYDKIHQRVFESKYARETEYDIIRLMDMLYESMSDSSLDEETVKIAFELTREINELINRDSSQELVGKLFMLLNCLCDRFSESIICDLQRSSRYPNRLFTSSNFDDSTITNDYLSIFIKLINLGYETEVFEILKNIMPNLKSIIRTKCIYDFDILPWAHKIADVISSMNNKKNIKRIIKKLLTDDAVSQKFKIILQRLLFDSTNAQVRELASHFDLPRTLERTFRPNVTRRRVERCLELINDPNYNRIIEEERQQQALQGMRNQYINTRDLSQSLGNQEVDIISDLISEAQRNEFLHGVIDENNETLQMLRENEGLRENVLSAMSVQTIDELQLAMELFSLENSRNNMLIENTLSSLQEMSERLDTVYINNGAESYTQLKRGIENQHKFHIKECEMAQNKVKENHKKIINDIVKKVFHEKIDEMNLEDPERVKQEVEDDINKMADELTDKFHEENKESVTMEAYSMIDGNKVENMVDNTEIASSVPRIVTRLNTLVNTSAPVATERRQVRRDNTVHLQRETDVNRSINNNLSSSVTWETTREVAHRATQQAQGATREVAHRATQQAREATQEVAHRATQQARETTRQVTHRVTQQARETAQIATQGTPRQITRQLAQIRTRQLENIESSVNNIAQQRSPQTRQESRAIEQRIKRIYSAPNRIADAERKSEKRLQKDNIKNSKKLEKAVNRMRENCANAAERRMNGEPSQRPRPSVFEQVGDRISRFMSNLDRTTEEQREAENASAQQGYRMINRQSKETADKKKDEENKRKEEKGKEKGKETEDKNDTSNRSRTGSNIHGMSSLRRDDENTDDKDLVYSRSNQSRDTTRR